jgi:VWFA-related protein
MHARTLLSLVIAAALVARADARQSPSQASPASPTFGARTEAVLVDVNVTDRKGRPVTNLTQADFQVFEDNTPQTILTFDRRAPEPNAPVGRAAAAAGLGPGTGGGKSTSTSTQQGPSITALAFDHLSSDSRTLAYQAAQRFLKERQADELAGVFIVDQALRIVSPYTTDGEKLSVAVKKVAETATIDLARERNGILEQFTVPSDTPNVASAEQQGRGQADHPYIDPLTKARNAGDYAMIAQLDMMMKMELAYRDLQYEMKGAATFNALLSLVDSLAVVPGRKSVIYFSEGLTIPSSQEARFRAIIHTANRSNVTVYTVDTMGLRVQSDQQATSRSVQEYGAMGIGDVERRGKFLDALEGNERVLKQDPAVSLGILADQTGGLLINNTNDLEDGVGRINTDRRNYYLLSYQSTNPALDGRFHRINVRVKNPALTVRARTGYVAMPMADVAPVFDYELPAIEALGQSPMPTAFPFDVIPSSVPLPGRPGLAMLSVTVPGTSLLLVGDEKQQRYGGGAVILARVVDANGKVVKKVSQQYRLNGDLVDAKSLGAKTLSFLRMVDLDPGTYRVDAAVYDSGGQKTSVISQALTIRPPAKTMVGDLLVIDHAERLTPEQIESSPNPLISDGLLIKPTLTPKISKHDRPDIAFALPLALSPNESAPPAKLALLSKSGDALATVALSLGMADADGRVLAIGHVPLDKVPAGRYELQVTVGSGGDAQVRRAPLTVVE